MKYRFSGKTVDILGAGISNMPAARLLASLGAILTVRDAKSESALGSRATELKSMGATLRLGSDYLDNITGEYILRSPGIRPDHPGITAAVERGSVLTSETELFLELCPGDVIAVTGSAGKSTTTSIIGLLLAEAEKAGGGKAFVGGNLGDPLMYRLGDMDLDSMIAAELSSFQLMTVDAAVKVAVITNITENHLNWHTGMDEYISAKARLLRHADTAVLGYSCPVCRSLGDSAPGAVYWFSATEKIPADVLRPGDRAYYIDGGAAVELLSDGTIRHLIDTSDILLPGVHNAANYLTAYAAVTAAEAGVTRDMLRRVATTFGGVPHRMELVRVKDGVRYYNSSIDSAPERTKAALSTMPRQPVYLILGGSDKHIPFEPLAEAIAEHGHVVAALIYGETGDKIEAALAAHENLGDMKIIRAKGETFRDQFENAVQLACEWARSGDVVMLSPACASFDAFENFERRGDRFKEIVNNL